MFSFFKHSSDLFFLWRENFRLKLFMLSIHHIFVIKSVYSRTQWTVCRQVANGWSTRRSEFKIYTLSSFFQKFHQIFYFDFFVLFQIRGNLHKDSTRGRIRYAFFSLSIHHDTFFSVTGHWGAKKKFASFRANFFGFLVHAAPRDYQIKPIIFLDRSKFVSHDSCAVVLSIMNFVVFFCVFFKFDGWNWCSESLWPQTALNYRKIAVKSQNIVIRGDVLPFPLLSAAMINRDFRRSIYLRKLGNLGTRWLEKKLTEVKTLYLLTFEPL